MILNFDQLSRSLNIGRIDADRTWIRTFTGKQFWPLAPRKQDVDFHDIAHSLACMNRYTGHTCAPYSVAQHVCHVADILPDCLKWDGLNHDDSEYVLTDVSTPVKRQLKEYSPAEDRIMRLLAKELHFNWPMHPYVKVADVILLKTEQRDLMGYLNPDYPDIQPLRIKIRPWGWRKAEREFLKRFNLLKPK